MTMGSDYNEKEMPHDEKVRCPKCRMQMHKRSLDRHLTVEHSPKLLYFCQRCSHKNNRRDNLRSHYRDCHPERVGEVEEIHGQSHEAHMHDRRQSEARRAETPRKKRLGRQRRLKLVTGVTRR